MALYLIPATIWLLLALRADWGQPCGRPLHAWAIVQVIFKFQFEQALFAKKYPNQKHKKKHARFAFAFEKTELPLCVCGR